MDKDRNVVLSLCTRLIHVVIGVPHLGPRRASQFTHPAADSTADLAGPNRYQPLWP